MMAAPLESEVALRPGRPEDEAFVIDSWLESYRRSVDVVGPIYFAFQRELIQRLLQRGRLLVAVDSEDDSTIMGWLLHETRGPVALVHYCYVKAPFRRFGIATQLLASIRATGCHYTHRTQAWLPLARRLGAHFNPYLRESP